MSSFDTPATPPEPTSPDVPVPVRRLTTKRKEMVVDIDGDLYTVREMTGTQLDSWRTQMGTRITTDAKGNARVGNFDRITASLLILCVIDPNGKPISLPVVSGWPATLQKELFDLCQQINGLTPEGEEATKKD